MFRLQSHQHYLFVLVTWLGNFSPTSFPNVYYILVLNIANRLDSLIIYQRLRTHQEHRQLRAHHQGHRRLWTHHQEHRRLWTYHQEHRRLWTHHQEHWRLCTHHQEQTYNQFSFSLIPSVPNSDNIARCITAMSSYHLRIGSIRCEYHFIFYLPQ